MAKDDTFKYLVWVPVGDAAEHLDEVGGSGGAGGRRVVVMKAAVLAVLAVHAAESAAVATAEAATRAASFADLVGVGVGIIGVCLVRAHAHAGEHRLREPATDQCSGDHDGKGGRHVQLLVLGREILRLRQKMNVNERERQR